MRRVARGWLGQLYREVQCPARATVGDANGGRGTRTGLGSCTGRRYSAAPSLAGIKEYRWVLVSRNQIEEAGHSGMRYLDHGDRGGEVPGRSG